MKMLARFGSSTNFNIGSLLFQGLLNFVEQMIEVAGVPVDLSPYDFVAMNCHTADEEVRTPHCTEEGDRVGFELKAFFSDRC